MQREEAELRLFKLFKINHFYDLQWKVIDQVMRGKRILFVARTGYGKSLCYQFPATQFEGLTVVFSPLLALMRDQVSKLQSLGIKAACINYEQPYEKNQQIIESAKNNQLKILYISPQRMENADWLESAGHLKLNMIVIDEAHCISMWGHGFIPAYRRIINLVRILPGKFPVLATTATATPRVQADVAVQMGGGIQLVRGDLLRENFKLRVVHATNEDEKLAWLGINLPKLEGTGIIYTGTIVKTMIYSEWLQHLNISSANYSSRLKPEARKLIEEGLMNDKWRCVVSTNALGMGFDKPDLRYIIHTQIPQSPIHYYQEIGRAGRDGKPANIILLYNPADRDLPEAFINGSKPPIEHYQRVIDAVKTRQMGERQIVEATNLKQTPVHIIIADLVDQGIINEVFVGKSRRYEIKFGAPAFDASKFEELRSFKLAELAKMVEYAETDACRMKFLTDYLGDAHKHDCGQCDNDLGYNNIVKMTSEWRTKIKDFWENNPPVLEVAGGSNLQNGIAAAYYGNSNVGAAIHKCKYEKGGDFPYFLLQMTINAFNKCLKGANYDLLVFVPPTESGRLVENFASMLARNLSIPFSRGLLKTRVTEPQKRFEPPLLKRRNVHDAFSYADAKELEGKSILLFDDICDSGATIKEIGRLLTKLGAAKITPLVIAKTVGGDLDDNS